MHFSLVLTQPTLLEKHSLLILQGNPTLRSPRLHDFPDITTILFYGHCVVASRGCLFICQEPPDMKTISDQRDMIMKFADRDGDDGIQKEELGLFFSVAQSRRVQEIKVDAESREAERRAEKEAEKKEDQKKADDGSSTSGNAGCCWLF